MAAQQAEDKRTKVLVRNLPPTLSEDGFRAVIDKIVGGRYDWLAYYPGRVRWEQLGGGLCEQGRCWRQLCMAPLLLGWGNAVAAAMSPQHWTEWVAGSPCV